MVRGDFSSGGPIRWGIIGCGDVTEVKSGPAFSQVDGSELVAVMRRNGDLARDYAERHGVLKWYDDADHLIYDSDVNAVYVATPPDSHADYAKRALEAGKPVYVEKPMARTSAECEAMIAASERAGLPLLVAYYRRQLPSFLYVRKLVSEGRIGDIRMVRVTLLHPAGPRESESSPANWRVVPDISGGGYFVDLASHQFDYLDYLLGPIVEARGLATNLADRYEAEDTVSASWRHESGAVGSGLWCFCAPHLAELDETEIVGSRGRIRFSFFAHSEVQLETDTGVETTRFEHPTNIQLPLIRTVVQHLRGAGDCPSTGVSGSRATRVMEAILHDGIGP